MADRADKPGKVNLPDTSKKTSKKGPHGGGNEYHQTKLVNSKFELATPRKGHKQKTNLEKLP